MKVKALVSFAGAFSMYKGEEKECNVKVILQDLLKAGYVEEVKANKKKVNTMKISEVTINDLKEYASVEHNYDDKMFQDILMAAKSYIKSYTGLNEEQIDNKEDLTIALMVLCNEMYDNRVFSVQDNKANTVITNILDMYAVNLL